MQDNLITVKQGLTFPLIWFKQPAHQPPPLQHGIKVKIGSYDNGRLAIVLTAPMEDEPSVDERWATATVNFPDEECPNGEVWIKNWSENAGMSAWLIENSIIYSEPVATTQSGYVKVYRHKLTEEFLALIAATSFGQFQRNLE